MEGFTIFLVILIDVGLAILFGNIANKKGYPGAAWGVIGLFFPILYLIILLVPKVNTQTYIVKQYDDSEDEEDDDDDVEDDEPGEIEENNMDDECESYHAPYLIIFLIILFFIIIIAISCYDSLKAESYDEFKNYTTAIIDYNNL